MPPKVRQLKADLRKAGFVELPRRGKGSHTMWEHPDLPGLTVTVSGKDGADAQPYQQHDVRDAVALVSRREQGIEKEQGGHA